MAQFMGDAKALPSGWVTFFVKQFAAFHIEQTGHSLAFVREFFNTPQAQLSDGQGDVFSRDRRDFRHTQTGLLQTASKLGYLFNRQVFYLSKIRSSTPFTAATHHEPFSLRYLS